MTALIPLVLFLTKQGSPSIARMNFPQRIYSISPVGPPGAHIVVVHALEPIGTKFKKPKTTYFLVDALSRTVTPLPDAYALAEKNTSDTLDMIMSPREV